jgi:predicted outer membrane protein
MRGRWITAGGLLLLAACRSDGRRGPALTTVALGAPPDQAAWRAEPSPLAPLAERLTMPRLWAITEARIEAALAAGRLAEERAPSTEVQAYAAKLVEEDAADLRALIGLARVEGIDVDAPAVRRDPTVAAARQATGETLARLRPLTGEAFQAAYVAAQPASLDLLAALGEQGERAASDVDLGNVLRTVAHHARQRAVAAAGLTAEACAERRPAPSGPPGR